MIIGMFIVGCGTTEDTTSNDGKGSIDLRAYLEKEDITKNYKLKNKAVGQAFSNQFYEEVSTVSETRIERKLEGITNSIININEQNLSYIDVADDVNTTMVYYRYVDVGDTLFSTDINSTKILRVGTQEIGTEEKIGVDSCKLVEELNGFTEGSETYTGDILKVKCTKNTTITTKVKDEFIGSVNYVNGTEDSVDIYFYYQKKDIGLIAAIDNDCISNNGKYPDDTIQCTDDNMSYSKTYYLGN